MLTRDELVGPRVQEHWGQQQRRSWRWPIGGYPRPAADPDPGVIPARHRQVARIAPQREHRAETLDPAD